MGETDVNAFPMLDQLEHDRQERSQALGYIMGIWDRCGQAGLCPKCRDQGTFTLGCQKRYIAAAVRGAAERRPRVRSFPEWVKEDRPDGTPFWLQRDITAGEIERFGDSIETFIIQLMIVAASHCVEHDRWRFVPIDPLTKQLNDCRVIGTDRGELALFVGRDLHVWANVETYGGFENARHGR